MRTRLMLIMVLALMVALPGTLLAQESNPEALVRSVFEALNAGDVEAALALAVSRWQELQVPDVRPVDEAAVPVIACGHRRTPNDLAPRAA